jgi:hypothetical protein
LSEGGEQSSPLAPARCHSGNSVSGVAESPLLSDLSTGGVLPSWCAHSTTATGPRLWAQFSPFHNRNCPHIVRTKLDVLSLRYANMPIWFGFPVLPVLAPSISVRKSRRQAQGQVLWYVVPRDDLPGDVRDQLWGGDVRHAGPNVDVIGASACASCSLAPYRGAVPPQLANMDRWRAFPSIVSKTPDPSSTKCVIPSSAQRVAFSLRCRQKTSGPPGKVSGWFEGR